MSIKLVTYDLRKPGRNYQRVYDYLKKFTYCKGMESVWLLDTTTTCKKIRDDLESLVDSNDIIFVVKITRDWASFNYSCADWLKRDSRNF